MYRNSLFLSSKFPSSRVWWALIEEFVPRAEEMAGEKEMACCVRGSHIYKDLWAVAIGEVLVCSREPAHVADRKKIRYKLYLCKYFCTFSVCKNVFTTKKVYCDSTPNIPIYMYCNSSYMNNQRTTSPL